MTGSGDGSHLDFGFSKVGMTCQQGMSGCAGELDSPHSRARAAAEEATTHLTQAALLEKSVKSRLALATDHFNRSPSRGFDYLQVGLDDGFHDQLSLLVAGAAIPHCRLPAVLLEGMWPELMPGMLL